MVMIIYCKFEKSSYKILFAAMVKSLYTLRRRNEAKSIVSTGCYLVDNQLQQYIYLCHMSQTCLKYGRQCEKFVVKQWRPHRATRF